MERAGPPKRCPYHPSRCPPACTWLAARNDARFESPPAKEAEAPAVGQREMPGGWGGFVATKEQKRNWAARAAAAKLVRAVDGSARDAEKRRKIDSGVYANPATRCGGNMLVPSSLSNVYVPSCLMDGRPPAAGPYHPAEAFSDLSMWHSQRLKERLALAACSESSPKASA